LREKKEREIRLVLEQSVKRCCPDFLGGYLIFFLVLYFARILGPGLLSFRRGQTGGSTFWSYVLLPKTKHEYFRQQKSQYVVSFYFWLLCWSLLQMTSTVQTLPQSTV
jgi:hypothetical protein